MRAFLKNRLFLIVLGVLLLALFVWFAGPSFAFAGFVPLASVLVRAVVIALVVAVIAGIEIGKRLRASRAGAQLMAGVARQAAAEAPNPDAVKLREQFEEAIALLKQKQRGGHRLYELPWYVIIGAPGSGKTTALVNSGLHFPLEQRVGKGALRGVGGTRNCDWWFTDEAIFLDTAGRYTTQDSDVDSDHAGWTAFLALLKKHRGRRPINGVILTVSAQDLMVHNPVEREAYVAAARRRLDELNRELKIQLPVYLMVTKCDLVAGFTEYFDDLDQPGRAQVWGVTFPYEQTRSGDAAAQLPAEFEALIGRLNERLFTRLEEERDVRRRPRVFGFPPQMAAVRDALCEFVVETFASTRFDRQILLRGVYFTSGTQEGMPIDRLLGSLRRQLAAAGEAVAAPAAGRGKAYFIEGLLKTVMLGESGLAGVNRRLEARQAAAQLALYVALLVAGVVGVAWLTVSFARNRAYIGDVSTSVDRLQQFPAAAARTSVPGLLARLDALRVVDDSANAYEADTPLRMRAGLYQGRSLGVAARDAYSRELGDAVLAVLAGRFEQRLRDFSLPPETVYEYLKGYLMLGEPGRLEPPHIADLASVEFESAYADDPESGRRIQEHFRRLLAHDQGLPQVGIDADLVAQARRTIQQASVPQLMLSRLKSEYSADSRAVRLDLAGGVGTDQVLRRRSGRSLSDPVSALFTKSVFLEVTSKNAVALGVEFLKDRWVWGDAAPALIDPLVLSRELTGVYEKAYIAEWDRVLADLDLAPLPTPERTKEALAILGRPTSPLRTLLATVDQNTYIVAPEPAAPAATGVGARLSGLVDRARQTTGLAQTKPGLEITRHFQEIHRLVSSESGPAPIDRVIDQVRAVQERVEPVGRAVGQTSPDDPAALQAIAQSATALKREAAALPPQIGAIVSALSDRTAAISRSGLSGSLDADYREAVLRPCMLYLNGRYPFSPGGEDMSVADFGRLFGHGGVYDKFFTEKLADLVDPSRRPWQWRPGATASFGPDIFMTAQRIRELFFPAGGNRVKLEFTLTPIEIVGAASSARLELDGQKLEYRHGPLEPVSMQWPGKPPGSASVSFEPRRAAPGFTSEWAWFRLLEASEVRKEADTRFVLTFKGGEFALTLRLNAESAQNPWDALRELQRFRCE